MSRSGAQWRIFIVAVIFVTLLSALSGRLVYLQVMHAEELVSKISKEKTEYLPAMRGSITDRNGSLLACDQPVRTVYADITHLATSRLARAAIAHAEGVTVNEVRARYPTKEGLFQRNCEVVSEAMASWLARPASEIEALLTKSKWQVQLVRGMPEEAAVRLKTYLDAQEITGIKCRNAMERYYPSSDRLTHVLGVVQQDGVDEKGIERSGLGIEGMEKSMNFQLAGKDGKREVKRDSKKLEIVGKRGDVVHPRHGNSLALTIDMGLQQIVEELLDEAMATYKPEKISVVLIRPNTGEILAMASRPHFSRESGKGNRRNYAVTDVYEPGSTFKLITFSGAFEHGVASPETGIFCHEGSFRSEDGHVKLRDHGYYGNLSAREVLAKSSNIGTYMLAQRLGSERFYDMIRAFGFGGKTGVELTGEAGGLIRHPKDWSGLSLSRLQMGYEVSVTPLQMASAVATIANGGMLYQPTLIHQWKDGEDQVLLPFQPRALRRVMSERAAGQVASCMLSVVGEEGTGKRAAIERWQVAGKTGTAKKYVEGLGYTSGRYVVSFAGFVPYDNPQFAGIVVVDDPKNEAKARYGGTVAAPIFGEIARRAMEELEISPGGTTPLIVSPAGIPLAVVPGSDTQDEDDVAVMKAQPVIERDLAFAREAQLPILRAQVVAEDPARQEAIIPRATPVEAQGQSAIVPRATPVPVFAEGGVMRATPYQGREAAR